MTHERSKRHNNRSDDEREGVPRGAFELVLANLSTDIFLSAMKLNQVHANLFVYRFAK